MGRDYGGVRGPAIAAAGGHHRRRRGQQGAVAGGRGGDGEAPAAAGRVRARAHEAAVAAGVGGAAVRVEGVDEGARGGGRDAARPDDADAVQRADGAPRPALPRQDLRRQGGLEGRRTPLRRHDQGQRATPEGELRQVHR